MTIKADDVFDTDVQKCGPAKSAWITASRISLTASCDIDNSFIWIEVIFLCGQECDHLCMELDTIIVSSGCEWVGLSTIDAMADDFTTMNDSGTDAKIWPRIIAG